ncbi:OmpA/MotB family protein [Defluviimonas salinarum]|uniref:Flagellar motor protein MotB n=1 Tax=Defluviimonas salinarum TaxID=2992147 RepID=A0ABT3J304_9RHOB|nr:flagellar motor protein MotB [Defluviimonas salinarum]MCW3782052.1 flagellar motor protein MotB [Defluviimonas salinarum]
MAGQTNAAPVIIKRKKVVAGGGHHGGAWKVAYADFVTAMMAFFMLMWLLNATTEKQRKGIADYFSPTIPLSRISGGGDGSFGGDSVFSEDQIAQNGTGASSLKPSKERQALGQTGTEASERAADAAAFAEEARRIEEALMGIGGESMVSAKAARHIVTRVTDEGLIVEIFDQDDAPLFVTDSDTPEQILTDLIAMVARVFGLAANNVAVNGHIRALPAVLRDNPSWDLSTARAMRARKMLENAGLDPERIERVTGHSDRQPAVKNPMAARNNRLEIVLLRSKR